MFDTQLEIVKENKVRWFGHVTRAKGTLANPILQSKVGRKISRGRPARQRLDECKRMDRAELE